ncbi:NADAR family protein [Methylorubrum thiocyanatum]|uniref:NADAR family protein n=1 Tax=Methylorubrum thiocyanatum TaxID=47958 RepID=UPI00383BD94F
MIFPPLPGDGRVLFFIRDQHEFGFLSHFHPAEIELDGETWPTVEHWYQAQKSSDPRYREAIRSASTPGRAKRLAGMPVSSRRDHGSWFLANGLLPREDWEAVKRDLMRRADAAKYDQHRDLAARLLATGGAEIVEDSPHDAHWGIGRTGLGANWAGRILMEVRDGLRSRKIL